MLDSVCLSGTAKAKNRRDVSYDDSLHRPISLLLFAFYVFPTESTCTHKSPRQRRRRRFPSPSLSQPQAHPLLPLPPSSSCRCSRVASPRRNHLRRPQRLAQGVMRQAQALVRGDAAGGGVGGRYRCRWGGGGDADGHGVCACACACVGGVVRLGGSIPPSRLSKQMKSSFGFGWDGSYARIRSPRSYRAPAPQWHRAPRSAARRPARRGRGPCRRRGGGRRAAAEAAAGLGRRRGGDGEGRCGRSRPV